MYFIVNMELKYKKEYRTYNDIIMADNVHECIEKSIKHFKDAFVKNDIIH